MKNKKGLKILLIILVLFGLAQLIRPHLNNGSASGPKDVTYTITVPENVAAVLQTSCYDCHSNHTDYPWYDRVAPVSWWISNHVSEGKEELNFSEFAAYPLRRQAKKMEEVGEQVEKHEMPIGSYTIMHGDAKLSPEQQKLLIDWAKTSEAKIRAQQ